MYRAPLNLATIVNATLAAQCQLVLDDTTGALLRTLAASKVGGVFLQLGTGAPQAGAWLLDGMDITSKLVVVVDEPRLLPIVQATLGNDIRVAAHVQDTLEFLDDIRSHELHLILFDTEPSDKRVVEAAAKLLAPGGVLVVLTTRSAQSFSNELYELLRQTQELQSTWLDGLLMVASRRPVRAKPIRRGARRRRRDAHKTEGF